MGIHIIWLNTTQLVLHLHYVFLGEEQHWTELSQHKFTSLPLLQIFRLPMKQSLVENNVTEPHEHAPIMVVCWEENDSQIYCSINQIAESLSSSSIVNRMNLIKSLHTFILHSKTTPHKTVHGSHHQPTISHFYDPPQKKQHCLRWNWFHQRRNVGRIQRVRNLGGWWSDFSWKRSPKN